MLPAVLPTVRHAAALEHAPQLPRPLGRELDPRLVLTVTQLPVAVVHRQQQCLVAEAHGLRAALAEQPLPLPGRCVGQLGPELLDPLPLEVHRDLPKGSCTFHKIHRVRRRIDLFELKIRLDKPSLQPQQGRVESALVHHLSINLAHQLVILPAMQQNTKKHQVVRNLVKRQISRTELFQTHVEALPIVPFYEPPQPSVALLPEGVQRFRLVRHVPPQEQCFFLRRQGQRVLPLLLLPDGHSLRLCKLPRGLCTAVRAEHLHVVIRGLLVQLRRRRLAESSAHDALQPQLLDLQLGAKTSLRGASEHRATAAAAEDDDGARRSNAATAAARAGVGDGPLVEQPERPHRSQAAAKPARSEAKRKPRPTMQSARRAK
mmetsp:Transcript_149292/g.479367  ORF Transcript_149292/g.479367 Transcript_149292/m.479367 type:complete len:375 (+) Transcript_149292:342-1466(+)